jgi:hypothetical protein
MKIEICAECASKLVAEDLKDLYLTINDWNVGMFSLDPEENRVQVEDFQKALKTVVEFYGGDV